ncbi:uncharacterized protein [Henckelia pumila]|uniref:uncharacterized protein n=1 Tax=Henckelia pumila TaxID=405737 RepID=UPI003C6E3133
MESKTTPEHSSLAGQMRSLKVEVDQIKGKVHGSFGKNGIALDQEIVNESLPQNLKMMRVTDYYGSTDAEEHLGRFENAAMLHCYTDMIKFQVFLTTLVKSAQQWFNQLEPDSSKVKRVPERFVKRFNSLALEILNCPSKVLISALSQGLRGGDLLRSLVKRAPSPYDDLLARVEKYINVEEAQRQQRDDKKMEGKEERYARPREPSNGEKGDLGRFLRYTPLKVYKECAMEICEDEDVLSHPHSTGAEKKISAQKGDARKYCTFHREYRHDTSEYQRLDKEIEKAIQSSPWLK